MVGRKPPISTKHLSRTVWKPLRHDKLYLITNDGTVFSPYVERELQAFADYRGCKSVHIRKVTYLVHRLVYEAWVGRIPTNKEINHIDGNPSNNRLENLECVTRQKNIDHARINNLVAHGEKHGSSKLTAKQVLEIAARVQLGANQNKLAKEYDISHGHVYLIKTRQIWRRVLQEGAACHK